MKVSNMWASNCKRVGAIGLLVAVSQLSGCLSVEPHGEPISPGKDSAPSYRPPASTIVDATPKVEEIKRAGNRSPYRVAGKQYWLLPTAVGYDEVGGASWYGDKFHGRKTSNGEVYNQYAMTAAHKTLPIPSYVRVTNLANNKQAIVRVNDRGPFHSKRIIDLSFAAAIKLGYVDHGVTQVRVEYIDPVIWQRQQVAKQAVKPPLKPVVSSPPVIAAEPQPYLQIVATSDKAKAHKLASEIRATVLELVTVTSVVAGSGSTLYRVRIGPLSDEQSVDSVQTQLDIAGINRGHLIRR